MQIKLILPLLSDVILVSSVSDFGLSNKPALVGHL